MRAAKIERRLRQTLVVVADRMVPEADLAPAPGTAAAARGTRRGALVAAVCAVAVAGVLVAINAQSDDTDVTSDFSSASTPAQPSSSVPPTATGATVLPKVSFSEVPQGFVPAAFRPITHEKPSPGVVAESSTTFVDGERRFNVTVREYREPSLAAKQMQFFERGGFTIVQHLGGGDDGPEVLTFELGDLGTPIPWYSAVTALDTYFVQVNSKDLTAEDLGRIAQGVRRP